MTMTGYKDVTLQLPVGPHYLGMFRAVSNGDYDPPNDAERRPFELRHAGDCCGEVRYHGDATDPAASKWMCMHCPSGKDVLFTDADLATLSLANICAKVYAVRYYASDEDIQKLDYDGRRGHGHQFLRALTAEELADHHQLYVEAAVSAYVRNRKEGK
jgi:hypothetical protein